MPEVAVLCKKVMEGVPLKLMQLANGVPLTLMQLASPRSLAARREWGPESCAAAVLEVAERQPWRPRVLVLMRDFQ